MKPSGGCHFPDFSWKILQKTGKRKMLNTVARLCKFTSDFISDNYLHSPTYALTVVPCKQPLHPWMHERIRPLLARSYMWGAAANNSSYSRKMQVFGTSPGPFCNPWAGEAVRMIFHIFFIVACKIFWPNVKSRFHLLKKCPNVLLGRNFW